MQTRVSAKYMPLFDPNCEARYFVFFGGRASSKSHTVSQYEYKALRGDDYLRGALMRFILTDVRDSSFRELKDRISEFGTEKAFDIKDLEITCGHNSLKGMGFRKSTGDQKSKLKSLANFNYVDIEEADEVPEEDFMQLDDSLRKKDTKTKIVLKLNPPDKNHWIIKRWFNLIPTEVEGYYMPVLKDKFKGKVIFVHSTYLDNKKNLPQQTIDNYEAYKETNPDHYYTMIKGYVSDGKRGRIFKNWKPISIEEYEKLEFIPFYGQDFGFTNDPTALVELKKHNNKLYVRELIYETGLTNKMLTERYEKLGINRLHPIYSDSEEAKTIAELRIADWNAKPAKKGAGSVNAGISMLIDLEVYYTEDSKGISEEVSKYCWALDRNKNPTNDPVDKDNHAMDAIRYGVYSNRE